MYLKVKTNTQNMNEMYSIVVKLRIVPVKSDPENDSFIDIFMCDIIYF
jgi:hypothetical protein